MKNTTIDGLTVRSPKKRTANTGAKAPKPTKTAKKSTTKTPARKPAAKKPRTTSARTIEPVSSAVRIDDFITAPRPRAPKPATELDEDLLDSFADDTPQDDGDFTEKSTEDWSDVLAEMGASNDSDGDGFINDGNSLSDTFENGEWSEEDGDKLAEEFGATEKKPKKSKKDKKAKDPRKKHKKRCIILGVVFGILAILLAVILIWGDAIIAKLTGGNSGLFDLFSAFVNDVTPFETDKNGRTNVLVFGTEGYNMEGASGYGYHEGAQLTDSIMVISFDQETKDVALLNLPRDMKASRACAAGKINEVYWCANQDGTDEKAGAQALTEQIEEMLDIDIQYYAHVNWGSLTNIVDTLGGITVTLDEDIFDYGFTNINIQAGVPTLLNGEEALGLARARHGTVSGDFTRGNSQQKIVEGIAQKFIDNKLSLPDAVNIINILGDNLRSNFSAENIKAGMHFISDFDPSTIRQVPLVNADDGTYYVSTANINGISFVVPAAGTYDFSVIQKYIAKMFSSDPAIREGATIAIYNGTETSGLAGNEQSRLEGKNYDVTIVSDVPVGTCDQKYCIYTNSPEMTGTKAALGDMYGVEVRTTDELSAGYLNGADFIIVIGQAPEAE